MPVKAVILQSVLGLRSLGTLKRRQFVLGLLRLQHNKKTIIWVKKFDLLGFSFSAFLDLTDSPLYIQNRPLPKGSKLETLEANLFQHNGPFIQFDTPLKVNLKHMNFFWIDGGSWVISGVPKTKAIVSFHIFQIEFNTILSILNVWNILKIFELRFDLWVWKSDE